MTTIGDRISEMLRVREMSPAELSRLSGVSSGLISELVNNRRTVTTTDTVKRLAKVLRIHPGYFLEEDDVIGPEYLLSHVPDPADRQFILREEGAVWVAITRELAEQGYGPERVKKLLEFLKDK